MAAGGSEALDVRRARTSVWVGVALVAAVLIAGCSTLSGADRTLASLRAAGYQQVGVNLRTGTGTPPDGLVDLSYRSGPTGDTGADAARAAKIVWQTLGYRFGALVIVKTSGGCAGPLCATRGTALGGESYDQLRAQLGPRPPSLDANIANAVPIPTWVLIVVPVVVVLVITAVVVAIVRARRRPPPPPPPWMQRPPPGRPQAPPGPRPA